jgi:hypothetical protein
MPHSSALIKNAQGNWQCVKDNKIHIFQIKIVKDKVGNTIHFTYMIKDNETTVINPKSVIDQPCRFYYETADTENGCLIATPEGYFVLDEADNEKMLLFKSRQLNDRSEDQFVCVRNTA